jgi:hypothetical protein
VRDARRADDDIAGAAFDGLVADPDQDMALQDEASICPYPDPARQITTCPGSTKGPRFGMCCGTRGDG